MVESLNSPTNERLPLSNIEKILYLNRWLNRHGVKMVLLDGDDTLWYTNEIFIRQMRAACLQLAQDTESSLNFWFDLMAKTNNETYITDGVNPAHWKKVVATMGQQVPINDVTANRTLDLLGLIYRTTPRLIPGTTEALAVLKKTDIPFGLVTHANTDWTRYKITALSLTEFFPWDNIYVINENGHKTVEEWQKAIRFFRVKPPECLIVGDSPRSDIVPAHTAGVKQLALVHNRGLWSVQDSPLPQSCRTVDNIKQLFDGLIIEEYLDWKSRSVTPGFR